MNDEERVALRVARECWLAGDRMIPIAETAFAAGIAYAQTQQAAMIAQARADERAAVVEECAKESAALRADGERLDWLEQHPWETESECFDLVENWRTKDGRRHGQGLRAALDSARAKESGDG